MSPMQLRPFAILEMCWLHQDVVLSPRVTAQPLRMPFSFEREIDFVVSLGGRLGFTPATGYRAAAQEKLEGVQPTALLRFASIAAMDFDDAYNQIKPDLDLACAVLSFYTTNSVTPIAAIIVEQDDTFRTRYFPTVEPAMIHLNGYTAMLPTILHAAERDPQIALALSLLRVGEQAARDDFRVFHYVQALDALASSTPGASINVRLRRFLKGIGVEPAPTPVDARRDFADVLADMRNTVAHGRPLNAFSVQPFTVPYLAEPDLDRRVRDFVRDVIARTADPSYRP